jgi:hypothetical protein
MNNAFDVMIVYKGISSQAICSASGRKKNPCLQEEVKWDRYRLALATRAFGYVCFDHSKNHTIARLEVK